VNKISSMSRSTMEDDGSLVYLIELEEKFTYKELMLK